jgi:serine O-acetyltransferase
MLLAIWVRLNGGFWAYRTRLIETSNPLLRKARRFVYTHYLEYLGSYISISAEFAGPPKFPHKPMGIFIAPGARIGRNAKIYQQVTIGSNETVGSKGFGAPRVGDNVFFGAGAKVIGNVQIGDGCVIGAGAIVVKDVPAGARALSPAARTL